MHSRPTILTRSTLTLLAAVVALWADPAGASPEEPRDLVQVSLSLKGDRNSPFHSIRGVRLRLPKSCLAAVTTTSAPLGWTAARGPKAIATRVGLERRIRLVPGVEWRSAVDVAQADSIQLVFDRARLLAELKRLHEAREAARPPESRRHFRPYLQFTIIYSQGSRASPTILIPAKGGAQEVAPFVSWTLKVVPS